jgi:hypothetical protein
MAICNSERDPEVERPSTSASATALLRTDIAESNRCSAISDWPSDVMTREGDTGKWEQERGQEKKTTREYEFRFSHNEKVIPF